MLMVDLHFPAIARVVSGLHRIYMGKYATGIIWLFTFGLFGIGQIYDSGVIVYRFTEIR